MATGGTFDTIHKGHKALLTEAFRIGKKVVIGVPSDQFIKKLGKTPKNLYSIRVENLKKYLDEKYLGRYQVTSLDDYFGPSIYDGSVEAIIVSEETEIRVELANKERVNRGFKPLEKIVVKILLAEDGKPISTTRIRTGEIDEEGRIKQT